MSVEIDFVDGDLTLDSNKNLTMEMLEAITEMEKALPQDTSVILQSQSFTNSPEREKKNKEEDEDPKNTSTSSKDTKGSYKVEQQTLQEIKQKTTQLQMLTETADDSILQAYCIIFKVAIPNTSLETEAMEKYLGHNQRYCNIIDLNHSDTIPRIKLLADICSIKVKFWKKKDPIQLLKKRKEVVTTFQNLHSSSIYDDVQIYRLVEFSNSFFNNGTIV